MNQPSKLMNRNFLLLWQGQLVSQIGSQVAIVAMVFWIKENYGSASLVSLLLIASVLPAAILGLAGGTFADRYPRRAIIVFGDIASGLMIFSLSAVSFTLPQAKSLVLTGLFVVAAVLGMISAFFKPAISAAIPDLVPDAQVSRAYSLSESSSQLATFLGQGLGGVLFEAAREYGGLSIILFFDGLTYLFSGASESLIEIPQKVAAPSVNWKHSLRTFQIETITGFQYVWKQANIRNIFLAASALNVFIVPLFGLLAFYVGDVLKVGASWYGFLLSSFGAGCLVGSVVTSVFSLTGESRSKTIVAGILTLSLALIGLGFAKQAYVALVLMALLGLATVLVGILTVSVVQMATPSEMRGRVFGLLATLTQGLSPIALGLSGLVTDRLGPSQIGWIYTLSGGIALGIAIALTFDKSLYTFLAYQAEEKN
jgi:MFS transporter, DHA3 family, macrolide efflux protein